MPGLLRVKDVLWQETDTIAGTLSRYSVNIRDLLALIPSEGPRLAWSVFPIGAATEITGDFAPLDLTAEDFCDQVDESDVGVFLSWNEMADVAAVINRTIWGTFIGCRDYNTFTGLISLYQDDWLYIHKAKPAFYNAVEIAFQVKPSAAATG